MSGIYFHIPFCKVKCNYCDFYKSTDFNQINFIVKALIEEIGLRRNYMNEKKIKTIYFGGGTPSILSISDITALLESVSEIFEVEYETEITLEANPDDLSAEYLKRLKEIGINRLSIGIQSFSDSDLKLMGRRHNSLQAINAVKLAQKVGFNNISLDLIYGLPGMSFKQWQTNLSTIFDMDIQHLSAYHLTYHKNTPLGIQLQKGIIKETEEGESLLQFEELIDTAERNGFIQYEISNFAREGFYSKHNTAYWNQTEYLGLGPSAHSFNFKTRYWNESSIKKYLISINKKLIAGEEEILTDNDRFNDYIITRLRTIWGVDSDFIMNEFGEKYFLHVVKIAGKFTSMANIERESNRIRITKKGMFISDKIISDFLILATE